MPLIQIIILALVQGITEFLPVSSSAHLVLIPAFLHWPAQSLIFDLSLHVGTLGAVMFYFRDDIVLLLKSIPHFLKGQWQMSSSQMIWFLIIGTLPSLMLGLLISHWGIKNLHHFGLIGSTCVIYGLLLYVIDRRSSSYRTLSTMTLKDAFYIGIAQSLALVPGTSRSGISITMARYLNFSRSDAAKFSFLLSIPAIIGAVTLTSIKAIHHEEILIFSDIFVGLIISFGVGLLTINFMMKWLQTSRFTPFVIYRAVLGLTLIVLWLMGRGQI